MPFDRWYNLKRNDINELKNFRFDKIFYYKFVFILFVCILNNLFNKGLYKTKNVLMS